MSQGETVPFPFASLAYVEKLCFTLGSFHSACTSERQDLISPLDNETPPLYQNNDQIVPLTGPQGGNKEIDHSKDKTSKSGYSQVKS